MSLGKSVLKTCIRIPGEHPCQSVITIKLLCNFWKGTFLAIMARIHGRTLCESNFIEIILRLPVVQLCLLWSTQILSFLSKDCLDQMLQKTMIYWGVCKQTNLQKQENVYLIVWNYDDLRTNKIESRKVFVESLFLHVHC